MLRFVTPATTSLRGSARNVAVLRNVRSKYESLKIKKLITDITDLDLSGGDRYSVSSFLTTKAFSVYYQKMRKVRVKKS
jgi:hypothetical protein